MGGSGKSHGKVKGKPDQGIYIVEAVLATRVQNGVTEYLVNWEGYPYSDNTWEPADNLTNNLMLADFLEKQQRSERSQAKGKHTAAKKKDPTPALVWGPSSAAFHVVRQGSSV